MKKTAKTLSMILLASTTAKAMDSQILVSADELKFYEQKNNLQGLSVKLFEIGVLVKTNRQEFFIINDLALSKVSDETFLSIVSNLISWLTEGKVNVDPKNWKNMTPSTQDYKL